MAAPSFPAALAQPRPVHPGRLLRDVVLPALPQTADDLADMIGVPRQALADVLAERAAVTADLALRLGRLFGNGPELWLNMQAQHDLREAQAVAGADLERIPTLHAPAA